jgi:hypothetical protein
MDGYGIGQELQALTVGPGCELAQYRSALCRLWDVGAVHRGTCSIGVGFRFGGLLAGGL